MTDENVRELIDDNCIAVDEATTVGETIDRIRDFTSDTETTVYYVYVLGDDDELLGVVSLRELLNEADSSTMSEIVAQDVVSAHESDSPQDVAAKLVQHGFAALPVLDADGTFLGIVRYDSVIEALSEQETKNILKGSDSYMPFGD